MSEEGAVKWFNEKKGYGFIQRTNEGNIFVHFSNIVGEGFRTLRDGDSVSFDVEETERGPQAIGVTRLG